VLWLCWGIYMLSFTYLFLLIKADEFHNQHFSPAFTQLLIAVILCILLDKVNDNNKF
jgi:cell shape-determining protein MreD